MIVSLCSLKARSHRGDAWGTHGRRMKNLQFGPVRCRSLGVRHHALLVRRARWANAGPALCIRRHSLCASGFFEHAQKCAKSSTHECTRQRHARRALRALDQRQTCVERARPAPDIRGAHALYTHSALATRRAFCVSSLAFPKLWQKIGTRPFFISNALAVRRRTRCMRGPFVQRASNTLCIRGSCYHVRSVYGLYAHCMRPVCALYALSALATRYAFGVSSL